MVSVKNEAGVLETGHGCRGQVQGWRKWIEMWLRLPCRKDSVWSGEGFLVAKNIILLTFDDNDGPRGLMRWVDRIVLRHQRWSGSRLGGTSESDA